MSIPKELLETVRRSSKLVSFNKRFVLWLGGAGLLIYGVYQSPAIVEGVENYLSTTSSSSTRKPDFSSPKLENKPIFIPTPTISALRIESKATVSSNPPKIEVTPTAMEAKLAPTKTSEPKPPVPTLRRQLVFTEPSQTPTPSLAPNPDAIE